MHIIGVLRAVHQSSAKCAEQGRQATVLAKDQPIGHFGIIHPEVTVTAP